MTDSLAPQSEPNNAEVYPNKLPNIVLIQPPLGPLRDKSKSLGIPSSKPRWLSSLLIALIVHSLLVAWWLLLNNRLELNQVPPRLLVRLVPAPQAEPTLLDQPLNPAPNLRQQQAIKPQGASSQIPSILASTAAQTSKPADPSLQIQVSTQLTAESETTAISPTTLENPHQRAPLPKPVNRSPVIERSVSKTTSSPASQQDSPKPGNPQPSSINTGPSANLANWRNNLMLKLNAAKRYPPRALRYRQQGITYVRFTLDRQGNLLAKGIEQSSGYPLLDEESLALLQRVQPLTPPPAETKDETLELVLPIKFFLRG